VMKRNLTSLLIAIASSSLLIGCCTTHQCCAQHNAIATEWEYKIASPGPGNASYQEKFLNDVGKDGWVLVQKDDRGRYIFKRAKK
jgi:hypothetical protein